MDTVFLIICHWTRSEYWVLGPHYATTVIMGQKFLISSHSQKSKIAHQTWTPSLDRVTNKLGTVRKLLLYTVGLYTGEIVDHLHDWPYAVNTTIEIIFASNCNLLLYHGNGRTHMYMLLYVYTIYNGWIVKRGS